MQQWPDADIAAEIQSRGVALSDYLVVGGSVCFKARSVFWATADDDIHNSAVVSYLRRHGVAEVDELPPQPPIDPKNFLKPG
jgi:hypothetical protein